MLGGGNTFLSTAPPAGSPGAQNANAPVVSPQQAAVNRDIAAMQPALSTATIWHQPTLEILNQQAGQLAGQFGMAQAAFGTAADAMRARAAADAAGVSLGPQYDAIQRAANNRQIAGLDAQDRLAFQALGNTFEGFDLATTQAWQGAGNAQERAKIEAYRNHLAARSDATARGALSGRGIKRTYKDITQDLEGALTRSQQDLANQLTGIGIQRDAATFGAQEQQMGRREQQEQLRDRNRMLDIKAQEYGVDRSRIGAALNEGLARLGLEQYTDSMRIMDGLMSNDLQRRAVAEQIFRDALESSPMAVGWGNGQPTNPEYNSDLGRQDSGQVQQRAIEGFTNAMRGGGF